MVTEVEIKALKYFLKLNNNLNESVICTYWHNDKLWKVTGILKGINCFNSIKIDNQIIRFIGNSSIIKSIYLSKNGEILYMNPYVIDSYNKEDIDLIEKQIFGKLMHLKDLKDYDYKKYKLLKKSFLYIKFEYLEEWLNLIDVLLENNKGYIINYILEYLKKLNTTLPLNSILEIINNLDLETEDKELIKNNIIKYGFNKEDLSLKKQIKKL